MATTYRIAAVGDWESVMGFRALGLDTYPVSGVAEAKEKIRELAKADCAVIYLTEQLAQGIGSAMGVSMDAGTLIQYLASGAMPELNAAVDAALQSSGSSAAELTAGWQAAESQLGAPLSAETIAGLKATLEQGKAEYEEGAAERDGF